MNESEVDNKWLALTPTLMAIAGVLLLMMPLRLFGDYIPTPIIPMMVIFFWSIYEPDYIPYPVVFAIGVFQDFASGGIVGVWPSIYLLSQWIVLQQRKYFLGRDQHVVWLGFAVTVSIAATVLWIEQSLLNKAFLPITTSLWQWVLTIAIYPAIAIAFSFIHKRAIMDEQ